MKIINVKQKNRHTTNCIISIIDAIGKNIELELSMDLIVKNRLSKDMEISEAVYNKLISEQRLIDAKQIAFCYISYRHRSKKQVIDKLKQKYFTDEEIDSAVGYLDKNNLLNDELFAKSFVKDILLTKKIGRNKVFNQLYSKGVDVEIANKVLDECFTVDTLESAILVAEQKYKFLINKKPIEKIKQSLFNRLIFKGFNFDEAKKAIETVMADSVDFINK